jgi:hypothetical protein
MKGLNWKSVGSKTSSQLATPNAATPALIASSCGLNLLIHNLVS